MTRKPEFKSDAFESIHSSAKALFRVGAISKTTLREFDDVCQAKLPNLTAKQPQRPA